MGMLFIKFSGNIVFLAICLLIVAVAIIARRYRLAYAQSITKSYKPTAWANNRGKFFGIGLISALVFTFLLSAWTIYDEIDRRIPRESFNIGDLSDIAKHNNTKAVLPSAPPPSATPEVPKPPVETPEKPKVITPDTKPIVNSEPQKTQDIPSPPSTNNNSSTASDKGDNNSTKTNDGKGTSSEIAKSRAEEMPIFPGCESEPTPLDREICTSRKMTEYVQKTVKYPDLAIKNNIVGVVIVSFVIEKDGSISDVKIVSEKRGNIVTADGAKKMELTSEKLGHGCSEAAILAVNAMNNFSKKIKGGRQNGHSVRVKSSIKVIFNLEELKKGK